MLNKNELRIGNHVRASAFGGKGESQWFHAYGQIHSLLDGETCKVGAGITWPYTGIYGIPVTYDLLVKNGFIDQVNNGWGCRLEVNSVDELCYYLDENTVRYQTKGSGFTRDLGIKFVHQLQNAYFILTGNELEFKL